jgi:replication factor C subunit 1
MDFKNKFVSWSKLETLSLQNIKQYLKAIEGRPDPFVKHNPSYIIVGKTCYESEDFDSWRLKHIPSDCEIISESDFLEHCSNLEPKQLLTDCLKPKTIKEVIGHQKLIEDIISWFNKKDRGHNGILLAGPPGIGKTTIAHLIPQSLGYQVQEFNASDCRSALAIKMIFSNIKKTKSLEKLCIVMDEIDGMSSGDRGGLVELANVIKTSCIPFICIANDHTNPKLKPIKSAVLEYKVDRPNKITIANSLKRKLDIIDSSNTYTIPMLEELCEKNGNDIRAIINYVEFNKILLSSSNTTSISATNKDPKHFLNIFSATRKLMYSKDDLYKKADYVSFDNSIIPLMVHEVYLSSADESKKSLSDVWKASDALSTFDMYDSYIHKKQQWGLLPSAINSVVETALYASGPTPQQMFPSFLGKTSKRNKHKRMLNEMASSLHQSRSQLVLESMDLLNKKLFDPLKDPKNISIVISDLDSMKLTREDLFETLAECSFIDYSKEIDGKTKAAFTREYNKTHTKSDSMKVTKETILECDDDLYDSDDSDDS